MGQFKPMVKMMTTEPTVELKLKKGGKVAKKADGGFMPMQSSMGSSMPARGGMMPAATPAKPSLAMRRKAMMASKPAMPMQAPTMKKGGVTAAKVEKELKAHEAKAASKAHKGMKTGGVAEAQGGYKTGGLAKSGIIPASASAKGAEGYKNTKMHDGGKKDVVPAKTGDIKLNKPAGYKEGGKVMGVIDNVTTSKPGVTNMTTGGVKLGNGGGYKKGGATKKYARGGEVVQDSGKAVRMPQGQKKPSAPVSITALSGTFKKGGKVKKMNEGGDAIIDRETKRMNFEKEQERRDNEGMRDAIMGAPGRAINRIKGFLGGIGNKPDLPSGSVTKTEKSVTVAPAKKRGGSVKC
jgi:hypothetical protein